MVVLVSSSWLLDLRSSSARQRPQRHALLAVLLALTMMRTTRAFLSTGNRRICKASSSRIHSNMDDLMNELLSGGANGQPKNISAYATQEESSAGGWRMIDWDAQRSVTLETPIPPSPVDVAMIRDRLVYLKRDDQLKLPGSQISGNKARKMLSLNFLDENFPSCLVSYGGPQSNAMLALAAIVRFQNDKAGLGPDDPGSKRFVYYTRNVPRFLKNQPNGNFFRALSLGMDLVEVSADEYKTMFGGDWGGRVEAPKSLQAPVAGDSVWVPQGGACGMAEAGTALLAREIVSFWANRGEGKPVTVCIPGGTCSTAGLLHRLIRELVDASPDEKLDIAVVVIPCVGDDAYARRQMMALNTETGGSPDDIPTVLAPSPVNSYDGPSVRENSGYYTQFGQPDAAILETFLEMRDEHEIVLDLLYGAPSWTLMLRHWRTKTDDASSFEPNAPFAGREIMYVHSGGLEGINSQLLRYRHKGLINFDEVQLPGRNTEAS